MQNIGAIEILVVLLLWLVPTILVGRLWLQRGHRLASYVVIVLILSWVAALILAYVLPRGRASASSAAG